MKINIISEIYVQIVCRIEWGLWFILKKIGGCKMWLMSEYDRCALNVKNRERIFSKLHHEKRLKRLSDDKVDKLLDGKVSMFEGSECDIELKLLNVETNYVK